MGAATAAAASGPCTTSMSLSANSIAVPGPREVTHRHSSSTTTRAAMSASVQPASESVWVKPGWQVACGGSRPAGCRQTAGAAQIAPYHAPASRCRRSAEMTAPDAPRLAAPGMPPGMAITS
eukprot:scaffold14594_cov127-Isochrysis_galbana.AAC.2